MLFNVPTPCQCKWFPWLECALFGACLPSLWQIMEVSRLPGEGLARDLGLHLMIVSALPALYVVIRLASTRPRLAWLFPVFFIGFGGWIGLLYEILSYLFSN
jgi:hypothetical protein